MIQSGEFMIDMFVPNLLGPPAKKPPKPSEPMIYSHLKEIKNIGINKFTW